MKKFRRMMALLLAMVMVLSMGITAFAEDNEQQTPTTYNITIKTDDDHFTHTYEIYQIFTGTPSTNDDGTTTLTDVQYGSSYPGGLTGSVPSAVLEAITDARAWAKANEDSLGSAVYTIPTDGTSYAAVPGWYLVLDKGYTNDGTDNDAISAYMVEVVDSVTEFVPKKEVPSVDKEVEDNDDGVATGDNDGFGETADHEIGESFKFKLTATIPAGDYSAYETYTAIFTDTMSTGITFENIESIKIGGQDASGEVSGIEEGDKGPKTWTITFENLTQVAGQELAEDLVIEVIYNAHLNDEAAINTASGTTTNKNTVSLTYSNNPDAIGDGETDTTPDDDVWVFTYQNTGNKVDANDEPVPDAEFILYQIEADDAETIAASTDEPTGTVVPLYKKTASEDYFVYDSTNATAYTEGAVASTIKTTSAGVFNIKGLDVGTYALYESVVPEGYVQAKNTVFTITATHSENDSGVANVDMTGSQISEDIINLTGSVLPTTGGMGTTLFYIVGAALVIGAGVVLVSRRRMGAN